MNRMLGLRPDGAGCACAWVSRYLCTWRKRTDAADPGTGTAARASRAQAEHSIHHGRRHRLVQRQRLQHGIMGYRTPNIDRIGKEGAVFTDWYGQQSCTAGRAAFITGQSPIRTGLTKVGLPGAELASGRSTRRSPMSSNPWAMPPASSARTISAIATSICRRCTASTSSSATSIT